MATKANWNYPTAIRFGAGRIAELPEALQGRRHQQSRCWSPMPGWSICR